ncbi:MAG: MarR family transcriptional regulator [Cytophagales bacterium]|nr:MAG: MarR family transcriptional regulator [Cytophagales bacterium]
MIGKRVEESLVLRLITLGDRLKRRRDILSQNLGISTQQWLLMLHLAHDPNLTSPNQTADDREPLLASELADALNVSRPNITNMINSLLDKGLVEQVEDEFDKRRKRLTLSQQGHELLEQLQPQRELLNSTLFEKYTKEEKEAFLRFAEQCLLTLEEQLPQHIRQTELVEML